MGPEFISPLLFSPRHKLIQGGALKSYVSTLDDSKGTLQNLLEHPYRDGTPTSPLLTKEAKDMACCLTTAQQSLRASQLGRPSVFALRLKHRVVTRMQRDSESQCNSRCWWTHIETQDVSATQRFVAPLPSQVLETTLIRRPSPRFSVASSRMLYNEIAHYSLPLCPASFPQRISEMLPVTACIST